MLDFAFHQSDAATPLNDAIFGSFTPSLLYADSGTRWGEGWKIDEQVDAHLLIQDVICGSFVFSKATTSLQSADGTLVPLRPQSSQVLAFLADRLGEIVRRDTLLSEIWAGVAVTDDSLTQCISDIRHALQDDNRVILKTIPKKGYVLFGVPATSRIMDAARLAQQKSSAANSLPGHVASQAPGFKEGEAQFKPVQRGVLSAHAAFAGGPPEDSKNPIQQASIQAELDARDVLPTLALVPPRSSVSGQEDALGQYLFAEVARFLGRSKDINLISRLSSSAASLSGLGLPEIGATLSADFVLSGVIFQEGATAMLSLEFADVATDFSIWSDTVEVSVVSRSDDAAIAEHIATQLRRAISANEVMRLQTNGLKNLKLFSVLEGAVGLMHRLSPSHFQSAKAHLEHVINAAPKHPVPLAWLARWHVLKAVQGWSETAESEGQVAIDLTQRALDFDPDNALALVCEGQVLAHFFKRVNAARARYDAALALNPSDAQGRSLRGMLLSYCDEGAEGRRDAERALHLTPHHPHRFMFLILAAGANVATGNYERAVTLAQESRRLNRSHVSTLRTLAVAQAGAGQVDDARKTAAEMMAHQPDFSVSNWLKASPSTNHTAGQIVADLMRSIGVPN